MMTALFLLLCYSLAFARLRTTQGALPFTPHQAQHLEQPLRYAVWGGWSGMLLLALGLCLGDVTADGGRALFVILAVTLFLTGGYDLLKMNRPKESPRNDASMGRDLFDAPLKPSGTVQLAEKLFASAVPVEQDDLTPWLPESLASRIISQQRLLEHQVQGLASQNLKLNTAYNEWKEKGTSALASLESERQAKNQLLQSNSALRTRSGTDELPLVQMTEEQLDQARKRRMQEIALIDDLRSKRISKKNAKPDGTLPLTFQ